MAISVNPTLSPRILTIPEADGDSITIQSLVNQIRNWEDNQMNLTYPSLLSASGKEDLGEGVRVGITAKLENARIKFADREVPTVCAVRGGNLVAVDAQGATIIPIEPSTNVSVAIAQSSSATLSETNTSGLTEEESNQLMNNLAVENSVQSILNRIGIPTSTIAETVGDLKDASWNKRVLIKINDNEYREDFYDGTGMTVVRSRKLTRVGDVMIREDLDQ